MEYTDRETEINLRETPAEMLAAQARRRANQERVEHANAVRLQLVMTYRTDAGKRAAVRAATMRRVLS